MIVPTTGAVGVAGWVLITTSDEATDIQPDEFSTVNVYVPDVSPDIVVLVPEPVVVPPGVLVNSHGSGNPLNTTLPVDTPQVGWVIVPITGAVCTGCALITTLAEAGEVQPDELVTVKLCVPVAKPDTVVLVPLPVIPPGFIVQLPEGNPFNTTLPVDTVHVGCVLVPTAGAEGVEGCALITTLAEAGEVQPEELVTVKLCVPVANPEMVVLVPLPVCPPGLIVQLPEGNPLNNTLPVDTLHVG